MRGSPYLCAVRADDGVLSLETLYYADEIRQPREQLDHLPERTRRRPGSSTWRAPDRVDERAVAAGGLPRQPTPTGSES